MFGGYNNHDNIIHKVASFLSKDTERIIKEYVGLVQQLLIPNKRYSYLDAVVINKKITNILFGRNISKTDNLDTVRYEERNNPYYIDSIFTLMDQYIDLEIHKLTGITYTEYKHMTPLEKNLILEHIKYKTLVSNLEYEEASKEMNEEKQKIDNSSLFDLGG